MLPSRLTCHRHPPPRGQICLTIPGHSKQTQPRLAQPVQSTHDAKSASAYPSSPSPATPAPTRSEELGRAPKAVCPEVFGRDGSEFSALWLCPCTQSPFPPLPPPPRWTREETAVVLQLDAPHPTPSLARLVLLCAWLALHQQDTGLSALHGVPKQEETSGNGRIWHSPGKGGSRLWEKDALRSRERRGIAPRYALRPRETSRPAVSTVPSAQRTCLGFCSVKG